MSRVTIARWVSRNSSPIYDHFIRQIKYACAKVAKVIAVCNIVFHLTISCCVPEIFAIKSGNMSEIAPKF